MSCQSAPDIYIYIYIHIYIFCCSPLFCFPMQHSLNPSNRPLR
ncbi:unnamed protein product, partial [Staurois parvus]